jgi:hypothetical protein
MQPSVIVVPATQWTPMAQELPPPSYLEAFSDARGWHRAAHRRSRGAKVAIVLGSVVAGVAMVVGIGAAMSVALRNSNVSFIGGSF